MNFLRGANSKGGREKLLFDSIYFPKNRMEIKDIGPRGEARVPGVPLGSASVTTIFTLQSDNNDVPCDISKLLLMTSPTLTLKNQNGRLRV